MILALVVVLDAVWLAAYLLALYDWRHADGFMDCWPNCTTGQEATKVILLGTPVMMAPIGIVLLIALGWRALPRST